MDGDDNISIIEQADYHKADAWFIDHGTTFIAVAEQLLSKCGIKPKLSIFLNPLHADYLSGYFYPVAGTYIHGPKIYRPLVKSGWSTHDFRNQKRDDWIYSNTVASQMDWSHIPILRQWTKAQHRLLNSNAKFNAKYLDDRGHRKHVGEWSEPDLDTYLFVQEITGLSLSSIRLIEAEIDEIYTHCAYYNPELDAYIARSLPKRHG